MKLRYGTFDFQTGETMVSFFGQARRYNARGRSQTLVKRMVVEGEIVASGQDAINARAAQILNALALEGGTVVFLKTDGTETVYKLDGPSSHGVRILENSLLQQEGKGHFATGLPFSITFEAEYTISDGDPLVFYEERITRIGTGGPRSVVVDIDNGIPVEQFTTSHSPITIIQSGSAVGSLTYPIQNLPIFPDAMRAPEDYQFTTGSPRLDGFQYVDWPVQWTYRMTLAADVSIPFPIPR